MSLTKSAAQMRRSELLKAFTKWRSFPTELNLEELFRCTLEQISDLNLNLVTVNAKLDAQERARQLTIREGEKDDSS